MKFRRARFNKEDLEQLLRESGKEEWEVMDIVSKYQFLIEHPELKKEPEYLEFMEKIQGFYK